jgi:2-methylcitrate dehydratase PrpD
MSTDTSQKTAIQTLARFAIQFNQAPVSGEVGHHAKRAVIDWFAALYPGLVTPAVQVLEAALADDLDRGASSLVNGRAATVRAAALIHGTAAHAAEVDDSFREAMYHPGAATIAAALAAAQAVNANGQQFLRAVVIGYEVSTRIGVVMGRAHYRYWHNTGTMGSFGAAAAAAHLYGLNEPEFANALALAATFTAGLQQAFRSESMAKPLHAGRAAEAGILAAQLAKQGMLTSLDILEGESGLGQAMSTGPDWSNIGATLGQDFHITRLTFKNHIGCGHTFPAIDGALGLQEEHGFEAKDIDRVDLGVYRPALDIAGHANPKSADEAKFSLHYMVASALVFGSVRLSAFEPDRLNDPLTRELMSRIHAKLDSDVDAEFPERRAARVVVTLRDGRRLERFQPDRKGDPELPLSDADLEGKLIELAAPVIGQAQAQALLVRLWNLETSEDLP